MKFSLPKRVHYHFRPELIPLAKNTLPLNKEASGETCSNHHPKQNFAILKIKKQFAKKVAK
jgi:hypothetical protein